MFYDNNMLCSNRCSFVHQQTDGDGDDDGDGSDTITSGISQQQLGTIGSTNSSVDNSLLIKLNGNQPKRLHVSNIPFRFRDPDLRQLFGVKVVIKFFMMNHDDKKNLKVNLIKI